MTLKDGVSWTEVNYRVVESAERDQTERMCRLISLYTLRKKIPRRRERPCKG